jgi:hypothetical protein
LAAWKAGVEVRAAFLARGKSVVDWAEAGQGVVKRAAVGLEEAGSAEEVMAEATEEAKVEEVMVTATPSRGA